MSPAAHLPPDRVVAFLDIMGFSDMVDRMETDGALYVSVRDTLKSIADQEYITIKFSSGPRRQSLIGPDRVFSHFSDSIVISAGTQDMGHERAAEMVLMLTYLTVSGLFRRKILLRGGMTVGWALHSERVLLGRAVVDAYRLEKQAHVPRVIISDKVVELLGATQELLRVDSDNCRYINMFSQTRAGETYDFLVAGKQIKDWLVEYSNRTELLPKYRWLARLYNQMIREWAEDECTRGAEPITLPGDAVAIAEQLPAPAMPLK